MDTSKLMSLGELYRELRIARGLKLKDVARDNLSVSQLSKFENGQTMLAADKLLLAVSGIYMTFEEFGYAVNGYKSSEFFQFGSKVTEMHAASDVEGIKTFLNEYKGKGVFSTYEKLNKIIIQTALFSLDANFRFSEEDKQFLVEYLYGIEEWTSYELYIFGNCTKILSTDDLIFLSKAFLERHQTYLSLSHFRKMAHVTFLNIILAFLERRQLFYVDFFMQKLEKTLRYQDMFTIIGLNFCKKINSYLQGEIDRQAIEDYIQVVENLGNPQFAVILKRTLKEIIDQNQ